jgi:hypothetical protein
MDSSALATAVKDTEGVYLNHLSKTQVWTLVTLDKRRIVAIKIFENQKLLQ